MTEYGKLAWQPGNDGCLFQWGHNGEHAFVPANAPQEAVGFLAKDGWKPIDVLLPSGTEAWSITLRRVTP